MCPDSEIGDSGRPEEERFAAYLSELKERGSATLVVGELPRGCYASFCRDMLGDPTSDPRFRLRVTTDETQDIATQVENNLSPSADRVPTRHIVSTFDARSATTASAISRANDTVTHVKDASLAKLGVAISQEIKEFEERNGGLEPAELRVCFDSLRPLIEEFDEEQVFKFLHILTGRIRSTSGMGHFHLQVESDDLVVGTFADLFDAVIELANRNDQLVQCWHVHDRDITSGWMPV